MQTWQIMMGLNLLSVLVCFALILWFRFRKNDGFDEYVETFQETIHSTTAKGDGRK